MMRLRRLSLDMFGQFSDKTFDFGEVGGASDFHIIHGPNEAGKTTTMEGYLRLLYGFPNRDPYDFLHQRKNLRVRGVLELDGVPRRFTRLPLRSADLVDESGNPLAEQAISAHLGGLSREDYRNLFCLDDDTVEKGGEDIANARGDIGSLLFSAAAGISDLSVVLDQTRSEADKLYRKRASSTRLAELKRELTEVEREIKESDISASAWRKLKQELRTAEGEEAEAREDRDALRLRAVEVGALIRALPMLDEHDRLESEVRSFADYPERLDIKPEELVSLNVEQGKLQSEIERLEAEIRNVDVEISNIEVDPKNLDLAQVLEEHDVLRGRMRPASIDLPKRERELANIQSDMSRAARELDVEEDCDPASLVKTSAEIDALEKAREAMRDAASAHDAENREVANQEKRIGDARKMLESRRAQTPERTGLSDQLARYDVDTLAPSFAQSQEALASAEENFERAMAELSAFGKKFEEVPDCPMDVETARGLSEQHDELRRQTERVEDALAQQGEELEINTSRIDGIRTDSGVIGDDDAQEALKKRDELWRAHLETLSPKSAKPFETAMKKVDGIFETRLGHARDLGELRQLRQSRIEAEIRVKNANEKLRELKKKSKAIEDKVKKAAGAVGLPELPAASFVSWLEKQALASDARLRLDKLIERNGPTMEKADLLLEGLLPMLELENPTFDEALAAARRLADEERGHLDEVKSLEKNLSRLEEDLRSRRMDLDRLSAAADEAAKAWNSRVGDMFGGAVEPEVLDGALGRLRDLRELRESGRQVRRQIASMKEDQRQFAEAMRELTARYEITVEDPLEAFDALRDIAARAAKDRDRSTELAEKLEAESHNLDEAKRRARDIDLQIREYSKMFPDTIDTGTPDALHRAVGKAREVIQTRSRVSDLGHQILSDLSAHDMDSARELLRDATTQRLEADAGSAKADLERAESRLSEATVARAKAERELETITGEEDVAELVGRRATLQLQIEETCLDFLELDLGLHVAQEAIRRYRDTHRGEMMQETERAFSELTNGAYNRLSSQPDGSSEILVAFDAGEAAKQVGDMSKGTRFQLYLALRAAAYEQMASQGGIRLPFFCDDIFETFDEDRTRAACRLMERIGRGGQAIYLTHHKHVVDIAREVCEEQPTVHSL